MSFVSLLSVVLGFVHVYLWRRMVRDTRMSGPLRSAATLALCVLALSVPAAFLWWTHSSRDSGALLPTLAFSWLGLVFYILLVFVLWDGVRLLGWARHTLQPKRVRAQPAGSVGLEAAFAEPEADARVQATAPAELESDGQHELASPLGPLERDTRRVFIARSAAASAWVAAAGIGALGLRSALVDVTTPELAIGLARFPRALDGYKIALISDVHIGPTLHARFLRAVVEQTNRLRPDLIAITGDLVDGRVAHIGDQIAELRALRARHGVYFVTGNHEYYSDADEWIAFLRKLGITVLMNQHVTLGDGPAARFDLAGIPDLHAGRSHRDAADALLATWGRDPERELVMLAHQPRHIEASAAVGAGLQLSGHTHGGQLYPFGALTLLAQPYIAGLHHHPGSDTQIYVTRGTGFWGPPMRVLAPAEITQLRLHSV